MTGNSRGHLLTFAKVKDPVNVSMTTEHLPTSLVHVCQNDPELISCAFRQMSYIEVNYWLSIFQTDILEHELNYV